MTVLHILWLPNDEGGKKDRDMNTCLPWHSREGMTSRFDGKQRNLENWHKIPQTKMKKKELNIKTSSLLNEVFNTAADGMCLIDKEFNIFAINTTMAKMFNLDKEDVLAKNATKF